MVKRKYKLAILFVILFIFASFSFVSAQGQNTNQVIKASNENQTVIDAVLMVNELHGRQFDFLAWFLGSVGTVLFFFLAYFGWETYKGRKAAIEKLRKEIEEKMKEEFDKKLSIFLKDKKGEIRKMMDEYLIGEQILGKKILVLKSNSNQDFGQIKKFLNNRNFKNIEIKRADDFEDSDIEYLRDLEEKRATGVVIYYPEGENAGEIEAILNILGKEKLEQDIPLIIYWPLKGFYGTGLKEETNVKIKNYLFRNYAQNPFTLAGSIYNMLAITNLEKYRKIK